MGGYSRPGRKAPEHRSEGGAATKVDGAERRLTFRRGEVGQCSEIERLYGAGKQPRNNNDSLIRDRVVSVGPLPGFDKKAAKDEMKANENERNAE